MFERKMTVQISEEDYLHFNSYHMKNRPAGKKAFLTNLLLAPVISLFAMIIILMVSRDPILIVAEAVFLTLFSALFMIFTKKRVLRRVRKTYRKTIKKDPEAFPPVEMTFFEDRFSAVEPKETGTVRYGLIKHVGSDEYGVYLYKNDLIGYALPARCFASPEDQAQFAEFIRKKAEEQKAEEVKV
jgi:hypothetical protein